MTKRAQLMAIAAALRSPFVPTVFRLLADADGYLDNVWPQLAPSVDTAGFLGSALYAADTALAAVEEAYAPMLTREALRAAGLAVPELDAIEAVLDVCEWVQPQLLLICAALVEAWQQPRVGGEGKVEPRVTGPREIAHLETPVKLVAADAGPLPAIADTLVVGVAPDLYRAVAAWPIYIEMAWAESQHLSAFPALRRRGRALYYYARSSSRFLAYPIRASHEALLAQGVSEDALVHARDALDAALSTTATMMVHCAAMRAGLDLTAREVASRR